MNLTFEYNFFEKNEFMKKQLLFSFLLFAISLSAQSPERYSLISVVFDDENTIEKLSSLGVETDHGTHVPGRYLKNYFSAKEIQNIKAAGFQTKIIIEDWDEYFSNKTVETRSGDCSNVADIKRYPIPANFKTGSQAGYFTYQEMLDNLDSMAAKYPELITPRTQIGDIKTHDDNSIYWMRMSKNAAVDENEPEVFYNALHHAREPMSLTQLIFFMWYMLENYGTDQEVTYLMDHTELYFVPCVNPDGYRYNEFTNPDGGGMWRKNRRDNQDGEFGVDLNRNYGYEWAFDDLGSSPATGSDVYRGTEEFSEPETRALKQFCEEHDFVIAMNYHAFGDLLIYPWGFSDTPSNDSTTFRNFGGAMARYNSYFAGTGSETVGYTVNGVSDDYMYGDEGIFAMTPEVGTGFWTEEPEIWENCQRTLWMNLVVANIPHEFGWARELSNFVIKETDGHVKFEYSQSGLSPSEMKVSLTGLSPEILATGDEVVYNLNLNEKTVDSINYTLFSDIEGGASLEFLLTVSSPFVSWTDTIRKSFAGNEVPVFTDPGEDVSGWLTGNNSWGVDNQFFYSAPSSFGDSPGEDYGRNQNLTFTLAETIDLTDVDIAKLNFWARWDTEADFDYAQILASADGFQFQPLCGIYTVLGTENQDEGEPLWEGQQLDWVEEIINLNDYLGESEVYIQFRFRSDRFVSGDGFNFDDFSLNVKNPDNSETTTFIENDFLKVRPNPSSENFILEIEGDQFSKTEGTVFIFNNLGEKTGEYALSDLIQNQYLVISTKDWNAGMYHLQIFLENKRTESKRLVLIK